MLEAGVEGLLRVEFLMDLSACVGGRMGEGEEWR